MMWDGGVKNVAEIRVLPFSDCSKTSRACAAPSLKCFDPKLGTRRYSFASRRTQGGSASSPTTTPRRCPLRLERFAAVLLLNLRSLALGLHLGEEHLFALASALPKLADMSAEVSPIAAEVSLIPRELPHSRVAGDALPDHQLHGQMLAQGAEPRPRIRGGWTALMLQETLWDERGGGGPADMSRGWRPSRPRC